MALSIKSLFGNAALSPIVLLALSSLHSLANAASASEYLDNAINATDVMNSVWYDASNGQWQDLWWNSANALTTLADLTALDSSNLLSTSTYFFETTFVQAQAANGGSFLNDFYDDEGWWAMGWLAVYDVTGNATYLNAANDIFTDELTGLNATCGGHLWAKDQNYNTAIGNELFLALAASLANRMPSGATASSGQSYLSYAVAEAEWFLNSGFINSNNTINDSLDLDSCTNNGTEPTFTYTQGVILGALVELNKATGNQTYLDTASAIAHGAIDHLTYSNGILTEPGYPGPPDTTGAQFKGVFPRNLQKLQAVAPDNAFVTFLQANADAIWSEDRNSTSFQIGPDWQGPWFDASAASQSSAIDCLVAAAAVLS